MNQPKTPFNFNVLEKIRRYLEAKEGFKLLAMRDTADGMSTEVQDAMGFRYEISIRTINRIRPALELMEQYEKASREDILHIPTQVLEKITRQGTEG